MSTFAELLCAASGLPSGTLEEHLCAAANRVVTGGGAGLQIVGIVEEPPPLIATVTPMPMLSGLLLELPAIVGALSPSPLLTGTLAVESIIGFVPGCPVSEDGMADLELKRGDYVEIDFVILGDPVDVAGVWTWNGTTTITASSTTGVSVGDWVRLPAQKSGELTYALFEVSAITPDVDITILNPTNLSIPSGAGLEAGSPVDITDSVTKFTLRIGDEAVIFKTSYSADDIQVVSAAGGRVRVKLCKQDFRAGDGTWLETGDLYHFDVENTRRLSAISLPGAATYQVATSGDTVVTIDDAADLALLKIGDIIVPTNENTIPFTVQENPTTRASLSDQVEVDITTLVATAAPRAFTAFRGNVKTPISGTAAIVADSTS